MSLRSIAAQIKVSPSYLSKVFRGERAISARLVGKLAKALQMDQHEIAETQRLVLEELEARKLGAVTGIRTVTRPEVARLVVDYAGFGPADFWLLEEWQHLATLNLVTTLGFIDSPDYIADRLGIPVFQARRTLALCFEHGYLARTPEGKIFRTKLKLRFPTQRSHPAVRNFHLAMGEKALVALRESPTESEFRQRLITGITFAGDPALLPKANEIIEDALYKAAELLAEGECTEVFQLNLQLFKLTKPRGDR